MNIYTNWEIHDINSRLENFKPSQPMVMLVNSHFTIEDGVALVIKEKGGDPSGVMRSVAR